MVRIQLASAIALLIQLSGAIIVDFTNPTSVKTAAKTIAGGMMNYYSANGGPSDIVSNVPGLLPSPYYWWEAGAMMGAMIDYWYYTGDTTWNEMVSQAIQFQVGSGQDFMPINETASLGNDDQAFWAFAAMSAAEMNFPNPPPTDPSWLSLAQAVFNEQAGRWDTATCGGGIRWQIIPYNAGYDLKNSIANGCFFNLAARLARYTGNDTYAQWAYKTWDWMRAIGLIDDRYNVYDNAESERLNCTQIDHNQWTYNAGTLLIGAANLYNYTGGNATWETRTQGLLDQSAHNFFVDDGVMIEICEANTACNDDQHSFKAYLSRWMAATTQMMPSTYNQIVGLLTSSAKAAVAQCTGTGGPALAGTVCGTKWNDNGAWDGTNGVGQQMTALEVMLGTLIQSVPAPLTNATGGTSQGNPTAGSGGDNPNILTGYVPPTAADKAGASIITLLLIIIGISAMVFMFSTAWEVSPEARAELLAAARREAASRRTIRPRNSVLTMSMVPGVEGEEADPKSQTYERALAMKGLTGERLSTIMPKGRNSVRPDMAEYSMSGGSGEIPKVNHSTSSELVTPVERTAAGLSGSETPSHADRPVSSAHPLPNIPVDAASHPLPQTPTDARMSMQGRRSMRERPVSALSGGSVNRASGSVRERPVSAVSTMSNNVSDPMFAAAPERVSRRLSKSSRKSRS